MQCHDHYNQLFLHVMMSSAMTTIFGSFRNIESNFLWNTSPAEDKPKGITANLNHPNSVLNVVKKDDSSSSS